MVMVERTLILPFSVCTTMQDCPVQAERSIVQPKKSCPCDERPNLETDKLTVAVDGSIPKPHGTGGCHDDLVAVPEYGAESILVQRRTDTTKQAVLTHAGRSMPMRT